MNTTNSALYAGVRVQLWEGKSRRPQSPGTAVADLARLPEKIARDAPRVARGKVWCLLCGSSRHVDGAECMRSGWPKCCGQTMTIDSPEERRARQCG